jgi:hypothetical protein
VRGLGLCQREGQAAAHIGGEAEHRVRGIIVARRDGDGAAVPPPPRLRRHSIQTAPVLSIVASISSRARPSLAPRLRGHRRIAASAVRARAES